MLLIDLDDGRAKTLELGHLKLPKGFHNFASNWLEDKYGEEMSLVQLYEDVHMRKKWKLYRRNSCSRFLVTVDGSKSRKEVEDEVFESLVYGGEPPKWPQGFGFGVVKSNKYGVHGLLRKEGHGKAHKRSNALWETFYITHRCRSIVLVYG
ncbi:hypothetical protein RDABS01_002534 [Bienertia sinuspersici]